MYSQIENNSDKKMRHHALKLKRSKNCMSQLQTFGSLAEIGNTMTKIIKTNIVTHHEKMAVKTSRKATQDSQGV